MEEKILFWEVLFVISSVPTRNYLSKGSNWSTRMRWLRMKTLERCQWCRSSVYFVNCKQANVFEQANVLWVHIKKKHFWRQDQVYHALCCINLCVTEIIPWQSYGWVSENFLQRSLLQTLILAKRCGSHSKWPAAHFSIYRFC